jgi:hypothetical protein
MSAPATEENEEGDSRQVEESSGGDYHRYSITGL